MEMVWRALRMLARHYYLHYFLVLSGLCLIDAVLVLVEPGLIFVIVRGRIPSAGDRLLLLNLAATVLLAALGAVFGRGSWAAWQQRRAVEKVHEWRWLILASAVSFSTLLALGLVSRNIPGATRICWAAAAVGAFAPLAFL